MLHLLSLLIGTVTLRPYVFVFLGVYLVLAAWQFGAGRAVAFLICGYFISWAAEFWSVHFGFPFGEYLYIPATVDREIWVAGVPLMDSMSYVFLAYASYTMARLALTPVRRQGFHLDMIEDAARPAATPPILGAVLMVALDIVIDPVALRGYRWFLGQIYGYPEGGAYFGITLANFGGWFLVALVLIRVLQYLTSRIPPSPFWDWGRRPVPFQALLGPGLYLGILGFNLAMTFLIGELTLGWAGVFIFLPFFTWLALKLLYSVQQ